MSILGPGDFFGRVWAQFTDERTGELRTGVVLWKDVFGAYRIVCDGEKLYVKPHQFIGLLPS